MQESIASHGTQALLLSFLVMSPLIQFIFILLEFYTSSLSFIWCNHALMLNNPLTNNRRGLGYEHIDPLLHQLTRITADSLRVIYLRTVNTILDHVLIFLLSTHLIVSITCTLSFIITIFPTRPFSHSLNLHPLIAQNFYGPRLGNIYIVHANWFFWGIYKAIIRPFLVVVSSSMRDKVHLLNDEKGTACFESAFSRLFVCERKTFFIFHLPIFNFTFSITCIYFAKFSFWD